MTQNIPLLLQNFFTKNPDIRGARNKGLVNRRALAKYIIEKEQLDINRYEALVTALRRFEVEPVPEETLRALKEINVSTKDKIAVVYLEKTEEVLRNVIKLMKVVDFNKNETLKFVQGSMSFKVFVDEHNVNKVKELFTKKDIIKTYQGVSELNLVFPKNAPQIRGIISYTTTELTMNKVNIVEIITGDPELIIYVKEQDLIVAYRALKRLTI